MKIIRLLFAFVIVSGSAASLAAQSDPFSTTGAQVLDLGRPVEFKVSNVRDEKKRAELLRLFGFFEAQYSAAGDGTIIPVEPFGPMPRLVRLAGTIHQHAGDGLYQFSFFSDPTANRFMLKGLPGVNWIEKQQVNVLAYHLGVQDWVNVMGAARRSELFQAIELNAEAHANSPTKEAFLESIKSGQAFSLVVPDKVTCKDCYGLGRYRGRTERGQNPSKEIFCDACDATGKATVLRCYQLSW